MNYSDFIYDFNLYLCERFGYRNSCSVMHNANGICVSVHVGEMDLYIRFWEYSCGVGHTFKADHQRIPPSSGAHPTACWHSTAAAATRQAATKSHVSDAFQTSFR